MTEGHIAIFGGTFNPIHFGHLRAAEEVREALGLSKVIFTPSCVPPLKSGDLAEVHCRLEMVRLAIKDNPHFDLSDMECRRGEKSYTVRTLEELKEQHPSIEPLFILGVDAFLDIPNWYKPERLIQLCDFIVVNRPPFCTEEILRSPFLKDEGMRLSRETQALLTLKSGRKVISINCTSIGISASDIRERLKKGMSIKYLLPESVESYIISNKLYNKSVE
ncbi:Nicotinate-nucleotide adenylyltransferase [hydrothermal vent metagenome]|uniref:Nicotinate-nucleotide adenylyltransferase n=1 Tax=hydrothermal vent metagenome TaxID=652676 RepID=A0A3B1D004_9ZZZZ